MHPITHQVFHPKQVECGLGCGNAAEYMSISLQAAALTRHIHLASTTSSETLGTILLLKAPWFYVQKDAR